MQVQIKYLYTDGAEIKQHDLVDVMGFVEEENKTFSGLYRIAFVNHESLVFYPLGHAPDTYAKVEMYFEHIEKLVKLDSKEIDKALEKVVKKR